MGKEHALIVCPGRGTYTKTELGYLQRHGGPFQARIDRIDQLRRERGQPAVSALDAADAFAPATHTAGEHASALIYACSLVDFLAVDRERYDLAALCGNSLGWYTALGLGGALDERGAFHLVNTMGALTAAHGVGGQLVYPVVDEQWRPDPARAETLARAMAEVNALEGCQLHDSICYGGYRVVGGNEAGLKELSKRLPKVEERFPLRLVNHAAFHTPLLGDVSERALASIPPETFRAPAAPLIDGRGAVWQPFSAQPEALRRYTLGHQVVAPFDFARALEVGLKEFAPDRVILLGPGTALGGAVGQVLVRLGWDGIESKDDFQRRQREAPYVLSMGLADQRARVVPR